MAVQPTVELGDYNELRVEPETVEVSQEDVDRVLDRLREGQAQWIPVEDRGLEMGDQAIADLTVTFPPEEGRPERQTERKDSEVILGENGYPEGFDRELLGARPGETRTFSLTWGTRPAPASAEADGRAGARRRRGGGDAEAARAEAARREAEGGAEAEGEAGARDAARRRPHHRLRRHRQGRQAQAAARAGRRLRQVPGRPRHPRRADGHRARPAGRGGPPLGPRGHREPGGRRRRRAGHLRDSGAPGGGGDGRPGPGAQPVPEQPGADRGALPQPGGAHPGGLAGGAAPAGGAPDQGPGDAGRGGRAGGARASPRTRSRTRSSAPPRATGSRRTRCAGP